ncbi:hypothetical protein BDD12DRAFT_918158 [Trichophaea hybrida]|nr:hypothetical protein BDD12DRAFT_918158 [Trichophaea hybrida]
MLAAPSSNESLEPGPATTAANTNSRLGPTPHHHHQHHHSRSSSARRSISATQGQLPSVLNGSTASNTMPTPVPPKQGHAQPPGIPMGPGVPPFDGSRSPPGSKNLNHVPCKFFRQGACQAGKACPFSHSTDPSNEAAPCKYFSKGNCKFGAKCALAHILPDGRRVNRPALNGLQFGRMDTGYTNHRSALHNSLMQANTGNVSHHTPNHSLGGQDDFPALPGQPIPQLDQSLSSSLPDAQFGSPRNPDGLPMASLGTSQRTLGPLDATLPASIDRYDYSYYAKHGPFASSVPNTFGVDSPPPSLPNSIRGETTVSALRRSAFGDDDGAELSRSAQLREGSFGERLLHSSAARRNKVYSSSYGGPQTLFNGFHGLGGSKDNGGATETEGTFAFEEDFLPESLSDLLTPAERNRRMSRTDDDALGRSFTAPGTPGETVGSPPLGSPGSWGPIIYRTKREDDHSQLSGLGHVGSPLRNSYLHSDTSPIARSLNRTANETLHFNSSPGRGIGGGISALTQSLKKSSIADSETSTLAKSITNGRPIERATSSPRLGNGKVHPIDEEPECQFNLEVEEDGPTRQTGGFTSLGTNTSGRTSGLGLDVSERYLSRRS